MREKRSWKPEVCLHRDSRGHLKGWTDQGLLGIPLSPGSASLPARQELRPLRWALIFGRAAGWQLTGQWAEAQILVSRGEMGEVLCPSRLGMSPDIPQPALDPEGPEGHKAALT